jgi:hypothetical protein
MRLRHPNIPSRLALALAACVLSALALVPGATGGAGDYPSPLYLSTAASSLAGSYNLTATAGPGIPTQTPTVAVGGAGNLTSGGLNYAYRYTVVTGDGESPPSPISSSLAVTAQQIVVGNLPTGVAVRLYRRKGSTGLFQRVTVPDLVNNPSPSYTDNIPDATVNSQGQLPLTQNRVAFVFGGVCGATNCGWAEFAPGVPLGLNNNSPMSAAAPTAPTTKGWLVDLPAGVHFAAGDWTFLVRTQSGSSASGIARLAIGLWEIDSSGAALGSALVDPAGAGEHTATNLIDTTNAPKTITHLVPNLPAFTLDEGNRLYLQFWRHQTAPYTTGNNDARIVTVHSNDGVSALEHPAVSTLPDAPVLASPADSAVTNSRSLSAYFSDPDAGDSGSLEFRVCTAPAAAGAECSPAVDSGSSANVANGAPGTWTAGAALAHGTTHYWQARDVDALGGRSAWTATRSFILDEAPTGATPARPLPGAFVRAGAPSLRASFEDPDGDSGRVRFRICTAPSGSGVACGPAVAAGLSAAVTDGGVATWRPGRSLRDRVYYWQARAEDGFGVLSPWSATRKLVVAQRLVRIMSPSRLVCTVGAKVSVNLRLAAAARVSARLFTRSRFDLEYSFGRRSQGPAKLTLSLPYSLQRPAVYWVRWTALRRGERAVASMRVDLRRPNGRPPSCG